MVGFVFSLAYRSAVAVPPLHDRTFCERIELVAERIYRNACIVDVRLILENGRDSLEYGVAWIGHHFRAIRVHHDSIGRLVLFVRFGADETTLITHFTIGKIESK